MSDTRRPLNQTNLVSWLKYFDVNYLDEATADLLSQLDINVPNERVTAIETAVVPDTQSWNAVTMAWMQRILASALHATNEELESDFSCIAMPFPRDLIDRAGLLLAMWDVVFPGERPNNSFKPKPLRGSA